MGRLRFKNSLKKTKMRNGFGKALLHFQSLLAQKPQKKEKMQLKTWLSFTLAFSFYGCKSIPPHTIYVLDSESKGGWGMRTDKPKEEPTWKPYLYMDNYVCRSPEDERLLIEWAKRNCQK